MAPRVSLSSIAGGAQEALAVLAGLAGPSRPLWLVGAAVRQLLVGHPLADLDLATPRDALALARALADRLGGRFVALDPERGAGRVVGAGVPAIDLVDFRAPDLEGDLRARDFTINALAVSLAALLREGAAEVIDPTGGLTDLREGVVRLAGPAAIAEDPVRGLRGARLAARPGWRLDPGTEAAIRAGAPGLATVAAERIRDELTAFLSEVRAAPGLRMLDRLGLLAVLLPESAAMRDTAQPLPHRFDVWEHSLRAVEGIDALLADLDRLAPWGPALRRHVEEPLGGDFTRRESLRLAALLHDVAKPETRAVIDGRIRFFGHDEAGARRIPGIVERWRLPRRVGQVLERLVAQHLRPMHLAQAGQITRRARFRFFRALGDDAWDLLLLALADAAALSGAAPFEVWAGEGGAVVRALMAGVEAQAAAAAAPRLLRGEDVMAAFGLAPGPAVGRLLERAGEAQALGLVRSRDEALEYLRRHVAPGRADDGAGTELDTPTDGCLE
ncbi:MAG TPA: HD domain-containing protein [Methylomirabilota bacterium]|nr:HD domain-containing protein [Methylomirabilota bacterium]